MLGASDWSGVVRSMSQLLRNQCQAGNALPHWQNDSIAEIELPRVWTVVGSERVIGTLSGAVPSRGKPLHL